MLSQDERNILYWQLLDRIKQVNPDWIFCFISREETTLLAYKPKDNSCMLEPNSRLESRVTVMIYNEFPLHMEALEGIMLSPNYDNFAGDNEILYINPEGMQAVNRK